MGEKFNTPTLDAFSKPWLNMFSRSPKTRLAWLAIVVEAGEPFVKATYNLEGDGPLVFDVYKAIVTLESAIAVEHYPVCLPLQPRWQVVCLHVRFNYLVMLKLV